MTEQEARGSLEGLKNEFGRKMPAGGQDGKGGNGGKPVRKAKARVSREVEAQANRAKFGRTKGEKLREALEQAWAVLADIRATAACPAAPIRLRASRSTIPTETINSPAKIAAANRLAPGRASPIKAATTPFWRSGTWSGKTAFISWVKT